MAIFLCNKSGCLNEGIEYNFVDGYDQVECGGCHTTLNPIEEQE
jgi:hypothetical protein